MKAEDFKNLIESVKEAAQLMKIYNKLPKVYKIRRKSDNAFYTGKWGAFKENGGKIYSRLSAARCACRCHNFTNPKEYEIVELITQELNTLGVTKWAGQ